MTSNKNEKQDESLQDHQVIGVQKFGLGEGLFQCESILRNEFVFFNAKVCLDLFDG